MATLGTVSCFTCVFHRVRMEDAGSVYAHWRTFDSQRLRFLPRRESSTVRLASFTFDGNHSAIDYSSYYHRLHRVCCLSRLVGTPTRRFSLI